MNDGEELYTAQQGSFFGVYILYNKNPKYKGKIYIGFTVNPERRIRQHNREIKGGAWKTGGNRGPWDMVLITHGFGTKLAALQFEWAWQNPQKSRRLSHLRRKQAKETIFSYRLRILSEMLTTGPWNRLPLTIQWLKQEYYQHFPVDKPPPMHMPIAYGEIKTAKKVIGSDKIVDEKDEVKDECSLSAKNCHLCDAPGEKNENNSQPLICIISSCDFVAHLKCMAETFLKQSKEEDDFLIPITGTCPKCNQEILWRDMVRQKKYALNEVEFGDSQGDGEASENDDLTDEDEFE